jgi:hypothetical protein
MEFEYYLPDETGNPIKKKTKNNSLIIIGANGSGKSKLGAWIEERDLKNIHRISAQRSLQFGEYFHLTSLEEAENTIFYGYKEQDFTKGRRWGWSSERKFTTTQLNDYEHVLSALVARKNCQNEGFIEECKNKECLGQCHPDVPSTIIDDLICIWSEIFPQRKLKFSDAKITTFSNVGEEYKGSEMSDGERVALYLIAQCLLFPNNKTFIIDEPEVHLHRSIMNKLWDSIERRRPECLFIYITHDTQFAARHKQAKKIWTKGFDGKNWELEEINDSVLPEQLLFDILGNRKAVIFVEGDAGSYDTKLYSEIYKDYYIIPCGSCNEVISQTRAMNNTPQLNELKCYGIIDRDYRNSNELKKLKESNIFSLEVAEVENLFLVEEILTVVNELMEHADESQITNVKEYIMKDRFEKEMHRQICKAVVAELKYKLTTFYVSDTSEGEAQESLGKLKDSISYDEIKVEKEEEYKNVINNLNYRKVLEIFNCKGLINSVGNFFGLENKEYCNYIIRQLHNGGDKSKKIKDAITLYLPSSIPITVKI